jgi:hypothetical protein
MSSIKRRTFLVRSVAAAGALGLTSFSSATQTFAGESIAKSHRPNPIAVSTYSFWRFKRNLKLPIETCIDEASFEWVIDSIEKCLPATEKRRFSAIIVFFFSTHFLCLTGAIL